MSSIDIVNVTLNVASPGTTREGYGIPLILSSVASWTERTRTYTSIAGVAVDFGAYTPEYKAALAILSQSPRPERIMIGRRANLPTQRFDIAVAAVRNAHVYKVTIIHPDGTQEVATTSASDADATNDEIVALLVTAINGLTGTAYHTASAVGSGGSQTVRLVSNTAGQWLDVRVNIDDLNIEQDHADPGLSADLTAIAVEDASWFAFVNPWNSTAEAAVATTWAAANKKYFAASTMHSEAATIASVSATDAAELAKDGATRLTQYVYAPHMSEFFEAARLGRFLPEDPGSTVWLNKTLVGVTAPILTETHRANLKAKKCDWYEEIGGIGMVRGDGQVASGAFIDDVIGLEWFQSEARADIVDLELNARKVAYTNAGIEQVAGTLRGTCARAVARGVFADEPAPVVSVPKLANVSPADRAARVLNDVEIAAYLAGGIQKVVITVNVA